MLLNGIFPKVGISLNDKSVSFPLKEELFTKLGTQLKETVEESLWWPPNQGDLASGEQKITHQELLAQIKPQEEVDPEKQAELKSACRQFESFFMYYLLKEMDKTVPREEGLMGNSMPQKFYREMFYERLADTMSESGMGLSKFLYDQLSQSLVNRIYK